FDVCCESRDLYPQFASELLGETGVDIELDQTGSLYLAFSNEESEELNARYRWQSEAGLPVELWSAEDIINAEPLVSRSVQMGLFFPCDWQVENRKLCIALKQYATQNEIAIYENTRVDSLLIDNGRVAGAVTDRGTFQADKIVLATGAWTSLIKLGDTTLPVNVEPVKGQMLSFAGAGNMFRHVLYTSRGYIVPRANGRLLAGSTTEHAGFEKAVTGAARSDLERMASRIAPAISTLREPEQWSGLRPYVAGGMPIVGPLNEIDDLYIASGHYRNGILLAPLTGQAVADHMIDRVDSALISNFGPVRVEHEKIGVTAA
ncbi:MAG: NAD(P)/FAD-dependent oxidoreductase, partial [Pyrinomonadaceae bacterium]